MLKENSKVRIYICDHQMYPAVKEKSKIENHDKIFKVRRHNGKFGIDYNTNRSPYICKGEEFTPFEAFSWNVIFEDVETGKRYHYSNIMENLEEI